MTKYKHNDIEGWMSEEELNWLFETSQKCNNIVEVGSFKGRSTHALLSGTQGKVTAIDSWKLHWDINHPHNGEVVFKEFKENLKEFTNLEIVKATSNETVNKYEDDSFDMVFLDFTVHYDEYLEAIKKWSIKIKEGGIICGHEYSDDWKEVKKAVDEVFGKPDGVVEMIWYKQL